MFMQVAKKEEFLQAVSSRSPYIHVKPGLDLRETRCCGAALDKSILYGVNMAGSYLGHATLREANLGRANLRGANLEYSDLRWANLAGADLRGANLRYARVCDANLSEADLSKADLTNTDLRNVSFCRANLSEANLNGAAIWADFTSANLRAADLRNTCLIGSILDNSVIDWATTLLPHYQIVPEFGGFRGFKAVVDKNSRDWCVLEIEVSDIAQRCNSLVSRECWADFVVPIYVYDLSGQFIDDAKRIFVSPDDGSVYQLGIVTVSRGYNNDVRLASGGGIRFYVTRSEAVEFAMRFGDK